MRSGVKTTAWLLVDQPKMNIRNCNVMLPTSLLLSQHVQCERATKGPASFHPVQPHAECLRQLTQCQQSSAAAQRVTHTVRPARQIHSTASLFKRSNECGVGAPPTLPRFICHAQGAAALR